MHYTVTVFAVVDFLSQKLVVLCCSFVHNKDLWLSIKKHLQPGHILPSVKYILLLSSEVADQVVPNLHVGMQTSLIVYIQTCSAIKTMSSAAA